MSKRKKNIPSWLQDKATQWIVALCSIVGLIVAVIQIFKSDNNNIKIVENVKPNIEDSLENTIRTDVKIVTDTEGFFLMKNQVDKNLFAVDGFEMILDISNKSQYPLIIDDIFLNNDTINYNYPLNKKDWTYDYVYDGAMDGSITCFEPEITMNNLLKSISILDSKKIATGEDSLSTIELESINPSLYERTKKTKSKNKIFYKIPSNETELISIRITPYHLEKLKKDAFGIKHKLIIHGFINGQAISVIQNLSLGTLFLNRDNFTNGIINDEIEKLPLDDSLDSQFDKHTGYQQSQLPDYIDIYKYTDMEKNIRIRWKNQSKKSAKIIIYDLDGHFINDTILYKANLDNTAAEDQEMIYLYNVSKLKEKAYIMKVIIDNNITQQKFYTLPDEY